MNIYQSGLADNLTHPDFFTKAINEYLREEKQLLLTLAEHYDCLIEAGCTRGRYTTAITATGRDYIGIDIADHHIAQARTIHRHIPKATFYCDDIDDPESVITTMAVTIKKSLLFFPFNSFGILTDPENVLRKIEQSGIHFVIFTYATDNTATGERAAYYSASGFSPLTLTHEVSGVRFTDPTGLDTIAYDADWFRNIFTRLGFQYRCLSFGAIGQAYYNF